MQTNTPHTWACTPSAPPALGPHKGIRVRLRSATGKRSRSSQKSRLLTLSAAGGQEDELFSHFCPCIQFSVSPESFLPSPFPSPLVPPTTTAPPPPAATRCLTSGRVSPPHVPAWLSTPPIPSQHVSSFFGALGGWEMNCRFNRTENRRFKQRQAACCERGTEATSGDLGFWSQARESEQEP